MTAERTDNEHHKKRPFAVTANTPDPGNASRTFVVTQEMRERFYALVERELGVPRDYWPGHEPDSESA